MAEPGPLGPHSRPGQDPAQTDHGSGPRPAWTSARSPVDRPRPSASARAQRVEEGSPVGAGAHHITQVSPHRAPRTALDPHPHSRSSHSRSNPDRPCSTRTSSRTRALGSRGVSRATGPGPPARLGPGSLAHMTRPAARRSRTQTESRTRHDSARPGSTLTSPHRRAHGSRTS